MSDNKIEVTQKELDALVDAGVEKEKLKILISDFQDHKRDEEKQLMAIDNNIAEIFGLMREFPDKVNKCKDQLEEDIHEELEKHYATENDLKALRKDMNSEFKELRGRFKWTMVLIVSVAGIAQYVATMWWLGLQITKVTGGG